MGGLHASWEMLNETIVMAGSYWSTLVADSPPISHAHAHKFRAAERDVRYKHFNKGNLKAYIELYNTLSLLFTRNTFFRIGNILFGSRNYLGLFL
jgi:hypothetical protein